MINGDLGFRAFAYVLRPIIFSMLSITENSWSICLDDNIQYKTVEVRSSLIAEGTKWLELTTSQPYKPCVTEVRLKDGMYNTLFFLL